MTRKKKTTGKQIDFSVRPRAAKELPATADAWVKEGQGADKPVKAEEGPQKRLTLNLPAGLHIAFKTRCIREDVTIQDKVRLLIEAYLAADLPATGQGDMPPA
jgi:hypothetical protein